MALDVARIKKDFPHAGQMVHMLMSVDKAGSLAHACLIRCKLQLDLAPKKRLIDKPSMT